MGIFTKDIKTMEDMFLHQLQDIYYAEQQLTKAIPKIGRYGNQCRPKGWSEGPRHRYE